MKTNTNTHTQLYIDVSKCYQRKMLNYKIIYKKESIVTRTLEKQPVDRKPHTKEEFIIKSKKNTQTHTHMNTQNA